MAWLSFCTWSMEFLVQMLPFRSHFQYVTSKIKSESFFFSLGRIITRLLCHHVIVIFVSDGSRRFGMILVVVLLGGFCCRKRRTSSQFLLKCIWTTMAMSFISFVGITKVISFEYQPPHDVRCIFDVTLKFIVTPF